MCLRVFCLWFILFGTLCASWTSVAISFLILGSFQLLSPQVFSHGLSFCLLLLGLLWFKCWVIWLVPEVSEVVFISFNSFFLFSFCFIYFHHSILYLTYPIFCLSWLVPSRVFFISVIALFIIDWLFFISSKFLLNFSCIFSILVSRLFICNSILFQDFGSFLLSLFWILFQVDSLLLFCLVWWAFIMFLYLLSIPVPFHLVQIAVLGVVFLYSGSLWFLFIMEVSPCGWCWMSGLSRFPG